MGKSMKLHLLVIIVATLCWAPCALADSMTLIGAGNNVMAGVYVGGYTANINGVATTVICDDFKDDSFVNESWTATMHSPGSLGSTMWGQTAPYNEAAWLALQLLTHTDKTTIGEIQFALWQLMDPNDPKQTPFALLAQAYGQNSAILAGAQAWLTQAQGQSYTNYLIYTPVPGTAANCNGNPCPANSPQEFLVVRVPEGGSALMFIFTAGLCCAAAIYSRLDWRPPDACKQREPNSLRSSDNCSEPIGIGLPFPGESTIVTT